MAARIDRFLCLVGILTGAISVHAGDPEILHANHLDTPVAPRASAAAAGLPPLGRQIALRLDSAQGEWDGMPLTFVTYTGNGVDLQIRITDAESWLLAPEPSTRFSLEYLFRWLPSVHLGISALPRSRTFADLSDANWQAYLSSLASFRGCRISVNDDSAANSEMIQILGGRTRVLDYTFAGETTNAEPRRSLQVWVELPKAILVLSLDGSSGEVERAQSGFIHFVYSLDQRG